MSQMFSRAPRGARLAAFVAGAALALPAAASAVPYEQVSRADGAQGSSAIGTMSFPAAVGDVGRYVGYDGAVLARLGNIANVRDVRLDKNVNYGGGIKRVYGFDRAETRALLGRTRSGRAEVVAVPIAGGTAKVIASYPVGNEFNNPFPEARISGNGRKALISDDAGLRLIEIATGTSKTLAPSIPPYAGRWNLSPTSLSDDGGVVVGHDIGAGTSTIFNGAQKLVIATGPAILASSGRYAAWTDPFDPSVGDVVVRDLKTGTQKRFPLPSTDGGRLVRWVSADGTKVVLGHGDQFTQGESVAVNTTTGVFSPFGGRLGGDFGGYGQWGDWSISGYHGALIAPGGRFAVVQSGWGQATLVDLTGTHIVGANDAVSPSNYFYPNAIGPNQCDGPTSTIYGVFSVAEDWLPKASKLVVTYKAGGTVIATDTLTSPLPFHWFPGYDIPGSAAAHTFPSSAKSVNVTLKLTDDQGRVSTESSDVAVQDVC